MKGFRLGETAYTEENFGAWTGFYDWLRDSDKNVLGVRYWPFKECEYVIERLEKLWYVKPNFPRDLEIYFSDRRSFDPKLSNDQDFVYDAIFRSDNGEIALGFGIESLTEADLMSLQKTQAVWVEAHPFSEARGRSPKPGDRRNVS